MSLLKGRTANLSKKLLNFSSEFRIWNTAGLLIKTTLTSAKYGFKKMQKK